MSLVLTTLGAAYLVFLAFENRVVHPNCMRKGVDIKVLKLKVLRKVKRGKSVNRAVAEVQVSPFIHIVKDILHVIHAQTAVFTHAVQ